MNTNLHWVVSVPHLSSQTRRLRGGHCLSPSVWWGKKAHKRKKKRTKFNHQIWHSNAIWKIKSLFIPQLSQPASLQQQELNNTNHVWQQQDFTVNQPVWSLKTIMWLRSKSGSFSSSQGCANWNLQGARARRILNRSKILDFKRKGGGSQSRQMGVTVWSWDAAWGSTTSRKTGSEFI